MKKNVLFNIIMGVLLCVLILTYFMFQDTWRKKLFVLETDKLLQKKQFQGTALVVKDDKVLFERSYGKANKEKDIPNSSDSEYYIASISKSILSTAMHQINEQNGVLLETPVSAYMPFGHQNITFRQLLTHTSGLSQHDEYAPFISNETLVQDIGNMKLLSKPGTTFWYSDSNYVILAMLIEKISGIPYEAYMKKNVFEPIGMNHTGFSHDISSIPKGTVGYTSNGSIPKYIQMEQLRGSGDIYTTVHDLYMFDEALFKKDFLSSDSFRKMMTTWNRIVPSYGDGWFVSEEMYYHMGVIPGWASWNSISHDGSTYVILLSNQDSFAKNSKSIGTRIMQEAKGIKVKKSND